MIMEVYFMASEVLLNELRSIKKELEKSKKRWQMKVYSSI